MEKAKKLKRWNAEDFVKAMQKTKSGGYQQDLPAPFLAWLGASIIQWSHAEENMVRVFQELINADTGAIPVREVFFSITSAPLKINILRKLLQRSSFNADKDDDYDVLINEYEKLSKVRNDLVHGLWWTHEDGGVYLSKSDTTGFSLTDAKEVKLEELEDIAKRIIAFKIRIDDVVRKSLIKRYGPKD